MKLTGLRRCPEGREIYPYEMREMAPVGSWVSLPYPDMRGQPLAMVMEASPSSLYMPELTHDGRLQPEKRSYLPKYVAMAKAGLKPPLVDTLEMEDGRVRVVDGHRRTLACIEAGLESIRIMMSPLIEVGSKKYPLTLELLQAKAREVAAQNREDVQAANDRKGPAHHRMVA